MANIFDEDVYLKGCHESMEFFIGEYLKRQKDKQQEQELFSSVFEKYDLFIAQVADLIKSLGYHSSIECSLVLSYLINKGILSKDLLFTPEPMKQSDEIITNFGTTIVRGNGCCRNFTALHEDVMKKLDYFVKQFYCFDPGIIFRNPHVAQANHVISLIEYNGNYYGIDLYNNENLFRFTRALVLRNISSVLSLKLYYKPYYEIITGDSNLDDINRNLRKYKQCCGKSILNPLAYENELKPAIKKAMNKKWDYLMDFHEQTNPLKSEIVEEIEEKIHTR